MLGRERREVARDKAEDLERVSFGHCACQALPLRRQLRHATLSWNLLNGQGLADLALDFGLRLCVHLELRSRRFYLAGLQRLSVQSANVRR